MKARAVQWDSNSYSGLCLENLTKAGTVQWDINLYSKLYLENLVKAGYIPMNDLHFSEVFRLVT